MEQGRPSIEQMETWVREVVDRHGDDGDRFAFSGILEDRDRLRAHVAEMRDALLESMGTEGGIPMTDRLADALEACGADLEGQRAQADAPLSDEETAVRGQLAAAWTEALAGVGALRSGEAGKGGAT